MDKMIIKGCGTMDEVLTALKTMQAVFGNDARLTDIATAKRFFEVNKVVGNQFDEGETQNDTCTSY